MNGIPLAEQAINEYGDATLEKPEGAACALFS
jgi:hypothetical protein